MTAHLIRLHMQHYLFISIYYYTDWDSSLTHLHVSEGAESNVLKLERRTPWLHQKQLCCSRDECWTHWVAWEAKWLTSQKQSKQLMRANVAQSHARGDAPEDWGCVSRWQAGRQADNQTGNNENMHSREKKCSPWCWDSSEWILGTSLQWHSNN